MSFLGKAAWSLGYAVGKLRIASLVTKHLYRRLEVRILANRALRREAEVAKLAVWIETLMLDRSKLVTGVQSIYCFGIGYLKDEDGNDGPFCWNAPIAMTVHLAGRPYFGLGVEFRGQVLCIRQMQGVKGTVIPRTLTDWPELLVRICTAFAEKNGFREVRVYKADQDPNYKYPSIDPGEGETEKEVIRKHQDRMRRRYDRVAQDLGFEKRKRYYAWRVPP